MEVAHELGVRLGKLAERAVQELDARPALVLTVGGLQRRLEAQPAELGLECAQAAPRARAATGIGAPDAPGVGGVVGVRTDAFGQRGEQPREEDVRRWVEAQRGRAVGEEVEVLRTANRPAVYRLDVDETGLAQPLEVQTDGVGVESEPLGEILGREGGGGARELAVHREARLVAEGLQHRELVGRSGHCA